MSMTFGELGGINFAGRRGTSTGWSMAHAKAPKMTSSNCGMSKGAAAQNTAAANAVAVRL